MPAFVYYGCVFCLFIQRIFANNYADYHGSTKSIGEQTIRK